VNLLESMAVQIRYRALPLGDLFNSLGDGAFMKAVREEADSPHGANYRRSWNRAAEELFTLDEDREILCSVGNALGSSDTAGQLAMLELNRELLQSRLREAAEASSRKGAMYRSVGLLTGLGLAIVVM
jgi:stage III sporulation protein AB